MIQTTTTKALPSALAAVDPDRLLLRVDLSRATSEAALSHSMVVQLRTDPQMSIDAGMNWDALVDAVTNGFDLDPLADRRLVLVLGPLDALRTSAPDAFVVLGGWLHQLVERADSPHRTGTPDWARPRVHVIVYGDDDAFLDPG